VIGYLLPWFFVFLLLSLLQNRKGADPTIVRNSQIERKTMHGVSPVPIALYFSTDSLVVLIALMWIGLLILLASKLSLFERLLRAAPRLLTLGVFEDQPHPDSLRTK